MFKMNQDQEDHLDYIKDEMEERYDYKYRAGAEEHSGTLSKDKGVVWMLENSLDEATDLAVYLLTIKQQLEELEHILSEKSCKNCRKALELLNK
jgi:hypothetical protein